DLLLRLNLVRGELRPRRARATPYRRHETFPVAPPRPVFRGLRLCGPGRRGGFLAGGALPLGAPAGPRALRRPPEGAGRHPWARGARGGRDGPLRHRSRILPV
ncbi:MAG: hypothetical protein AVDCRST_MAG22-3553, partial [uncultured Rubrobacteraceae bacterium]